MLNDTQLWKTARTCWHRLLISSLLKDYEFKKLFAKVCTWSIKLPKALSIHIFCFLIAVFYEALPGNDERLHFG